MSIKAPKGTNYFANGIPIESEVVLNVGTEFTVESANVRNGFLELVLGIVRKSR